MKKEFIPKDTAAVHSTILLARIKQNLYLNKYIEICVHNMGIKNIDDKSPTVAQHKYAGNFKCSISYMNTA
jgi:hypothetical protein